MVTAIVLTVLAGAATTVGGLLAVHRKVRSDAGLAVALAFAAGAMILVSLAEIVPKGVRSLMPAIGTGDAWLATLALTAVGIGAVMAVQRLVPDEIEATTRLAIDQATSADSPAVTTLSRERLLRSGVVVAVVVSAHNVPEGLATFVAALDDPAAGLAIAVAIAIHNIPEGVAVAAPVYGATGSRSRALTYATLSGMAEPVGALVGYAVLAAVLPEAAYGVVFGLIAGMMLQISVSELVPSAWRLAPRASTVLAVVAGAGVMVLSLVLLRIG